MSLAVFHIYFAKNANDQSTARAASLLSGFGSARSPGDFLSSCGLMDAVGQGHACLGLSTALILALGLALFVFGQLLGFLRFRSSRNRTRP